jgi:hypothetical protein
MPVEVALKPLGVVTSDEIHPDAGNERRGLVGERFFLQKVEFQTACDVAIAVGAATGEFGPHADVDADDTQVGLLVGRFANRQLAEVQLVAGIEHRDRPIVKPFLSKKSNAMPNPGRRCACPGLCCATASR